MPQSGVRENRGAEDEHAVLRVVETLKGVTSRQLKENVLHIIE